MTQEEKNEVTQFLDCVSCRINEAKDHIKHHNYGLALEVLSEAYPLLKIKVD